MRKISMTIVILAFVVLVPVAWADTPDTSCSLIRESDAGSPSGNIILEHYRNDSVTTGTYQEWLSEKNNRNNRALLIAHDHNIEGILFSPDESRLIINNHTLSNETIVHLFIKKNGVHYQEAKNPNLNDLLWHFFMQVNDPQNYQERVSSDVRNPSPFDHRYIDCLRWASDGNALLFELTGHSGSKNHIEGSWYCVLDLKTMKPSLDLGIMNRGKPVIAENVDQGQNQNGTLLTAIPTKPNLEPSLIVANGRTNNKKKDDRKWLFVFDPKTQQPSLDLSMVNRGKVMLDGKLR